MDHARVRPTPQSRLTGDGESIDASVRALEPAIDIAQHNLAGIRRHGTQLTGTARPGAQQRRAGKGLLAVCGHHRLAGYATRRRIALPARVLAQQLASPAMIPPGLI